MTDFNDLNQAGASQDSDQLAIVRGAGTFRQTIANILAAMRAGNSLPASTARATSAAHRREWQTRLGIPDDWSEIPVNTQIAVGKVVEHGGLYFAARVAHARGGTGPDGDDANWILLSNWGGAWTDKWWPRGTIVSHNGYPYAATGVVRAGSPAPNAAANVLWLLLGTIPAQVRSYSANTIVTAAQRGWTFRATGATTRLLSLPNASGAGEVDDGWDLVCANGSSADQTISPNGTDQIGGAGALTLAPGRAVRLQKVASGVWIVIADTKDEVGSGGAEFMPSKANLYQAVKAIFVHNTAVSADDANSELDFATGVASTLNDNSIAPIKAQAGTTAQKKAWRERLASSSIALVANALPAIANHNTGDTLVIGRGGATVVPFREIDEPSTELTATAAGDVMMLLAAGWTRIGNFFSGGIAAAAAQTKADANETTINRMSVFEHYELDPGGISGTDFPEFIALKCSRKIVNKTVDQIAVLLGGQNVGNVIRNTSPTPPATDPAEPFNNGVPELSGGIINLVLNTAARTNLKNSVGVANRSPQFIRCQVTVTFTDGTVSEDILNFGTNNNAFDIARNPDFVAGVRTTAAVTPGPVTVISNIASYDATQNRFEDSSGNEVTVPNGAIAFVTDAAYAAAVADTGFTPNAAAFFFTPTAIHYGGTRYGRQRERFDRAVGASPATLPVGSYEISAKLTDATGNIASKRLLLSQIAAADERYQVQVNRNQNTSLTVRYAPATRTLHYSVQSGDTGSIRVIGEA